MTDQLGKTITLGPRYALRVEDIRPGLALRIQCLPCGHVGTVAADVLRAKHPPSERVKLVADRFRCLSCGSGGAGVMSLWSVVEAEP
jgi:hypothetical protein